MTPAAEARERPPGERVWDPPNRIGFADQLRGLGGTVAPVLAGFSLATIATLQTADAGPPLQEWCLVAFGAAAVLLLMAMQFSSRALGRGAPPGQRLEWDPLARTTEARFQAARDQQLREMAEVRVYWRWAGLCYDLGLIGFLAGVVLLMVPEFWSLERGLAVTIAAVALAIECIWAWRTWRATLRHPVRRLRLPRDRLEAPRLEAGVLAALDVDAKPAGSAPDERFNGRAAKESVAAGDLRTAPPGRPAQDS